MFLRRLTNTTRNITKLPTTCLSPITRLLPTSNILFTFPHKIPYSVLIANNKKAPKIISNGELFSRILTAPNTSQPTMQQTVTQKTPEKQEQKFTFTSKELCEKSMAGIFFSTLGMFLLTVLTYILEFTNEQRSIVNSTLLWICMAIIIAMIA